MTTHRILKIAAIAILAALGIAGAWMLRGGELDAEREQRARGLRSAP